MAESLLPVVLKHLRRAALLQSGVFPPDSELLERFLASRDETAFQALLRRHGSMVMGVCRRLLRHEADAEDAFQATFLVLARKASSVRPYGQVSNWLYGVAYHTALKARAAAGKRRAQERQAWTMARMATADESRQQILSLLDLELHRLPDKYRAAIVLCHLEGKSYTEAAAELGCPRGTLSGRLTRGRALLARRLARHGLGCGGGVLTAVLAQNSMATVPPRLIIGTAKAATAIAAGKAAAMGLVTANVAALTQGVIKTMFLTKLKSFIGVALLTLTVAGTGGGLVSRYTQAQEVPASPGVAQKSPETGKQHRDDDPAMLRREIERLRAELEQTRLDLRRAEQEVVVMKARADLGRAEAQAAVLKDQEARLKADADARQTKVRTQAMQMQKLKAELEKARAENDARQVVNPVTTLRFSAEYERPKAAKKASEFIKTYRSTTNALNDPQAIKATSPDGRMVAVDQDRALNMIDTETGKLYFRSFFHTEPVTALAFSPDGKVLASGSKDKTIIILDSSTGRQIRKLVVLNPVTTVRFTAVGTTLWIKEDNGTEKEFDLETGKALPPKPQPLERK